MDDAQRLRKLQEDVLGATKAMIELNAPGLPVLMLGEYIGKIGGRVATLTEYTEAEEPNPFRLQVSVTERPDVERATMVVIVDKVLGWG